MVDHDGIGLLRYCRLNQRLAGSYAADELAYRAPAFDLQAVGAVILKARGLQHGVQGG